MVGKSYDWEGGAPLEEHTKTKHKILRAYFQQYLVTRCQLPQRERFSLTLPIEQPPAPALGGPGAELEPNAMQHFQQMTARRKVKD